MKRIQKIIYFILTMSACLLTGCSQEKKIPVVIINGKELYMSDFLYHIYEVEKEGNQLEDYYQKNLGCSYWDYEYNGTTMRELAKSSVLTKVVMYEILSEQAARKGIKLTQNELSSNEAVIDNMIRTFSESELNKVGLTRDVILNTVKKISLGEKYRNEISKNFHIDEHAIRDTINQEDYREYKTECIFAPIVSKKGDPVTPLDQDGKEAALNTINKAYKDQESGYEFDYLLNKYPKLTYETRYFITNDSTYEKEYQNTAIAMDNGDYSQVILTENGYYIIHMLDNNSKDKYEEAVKAAITSEEDKQFEAAYNKLKKKYKITVNFEYWDTITIGSITGSVTSVD